VYRWGDDLSSMRGSNAYMRGTTELSSALPDFKIPIGHLLCILTGKYAIDSLYLILVSFGASPIINTPFFSSNMLAHPFKLRRTLKHQEHFSSSYVIQSLEHWSSFAWLSSIDSWSFLLEGG
jgi:hypothetical protein